MKRRKTILSLALMLPMFVAGATQTDGVNALRLHAASGNDVTILLGERPVVTFAGNDLVVTTSQNEVSYSSDAFQKFTYEYVEQTAIGGTEVKGVLLSLSGGSVQVSNLAPYAQVSLYNVDGKLVGTAAADGNGFATLSLDGMNSQVYVLKTSSITLKFRKS